MEQLDSGRHRWGLVAVTAALFVVGAFMELWLAAKPEGSLVRAAAASSEIPPLAVTTAVAEPLRPMARDDEELAPTDDTVPAQQPREGEAWSLLRVPLTCAVVPPLVGPPVVGDATPVTWPGTDHEPQPDGLSYPAIPIRVTVDAGVATATTFLPVRSSDGAYTRHVARLVLPGFAPTEFAFISTGPDQPVTCVAPIELAAAAAGVVGTVRFDDGSPAEGAIVAGCGSRVVTGSEGDYFLLPRAEEPCSLQARHAPGTAAESVPQRIDPLAAKDQVLDFVVMVPEQPDPGVEIFRTDDGEVWVRPDGSGPWEQELSYGARIIQVGDVPPDELSDEDMLRAMVSLDEAIHIQKSFETEDGQHVLVNSTITAL